MKLCVGICVGITFDCFLLIILNHEVKLNVRVRPSHQECKIKLPTGGFFCVIFSESYTQLIYHSDKAPIIGAPSC